MRFNCWNQRLTSLPEDVKARRLLEEGSFDSTDLRIEAGWVGLKSVTF